MPSDKVTAELFGRLAAFDWYEGVEIIKLAFYDADPIEAYALGLDTALQQMWFLWKERSGELVLCNATIKGFRRFPADEGYKLEWLWEQVSARQPAGGCVLIEGGAQL